MLHEGNPSKSIIVSFLPFQDALQFQAPQTDESCFGPEMRCHFSELPSLIHHTRVTFPEDLIQLNEKEAYKLDFYISWNTNGT